MGSTGSGGSYGRLEPDGVDCPLKFTVVLVDVPQTGNATYAFGLEKGARLQANASDSLVVLRHEEFDIGYLPPQYMYLVDCIIAGWKYSASISNIDGSEQAPRIEVLVIGTPP